MALTWKYGHSWYNESHFENESLLKKCVTLEKIAHTRKMRRTWNNGSHLENT